MMNRACFASSRLRALASLLAAATMLQGCIEAAVVGGAATATLIATDRRQPEIVLGDERIELTASSRISDAVKDKAHVNVTSYNSTVLITGEAPNAQLKAEVERIAGQVPQVKSVVNELQMAGISSLASRANDTYLTGKVKGNFVSVSKFSPNHVKVVSESGVVYLLGLVTREEADAATDIARSTSGVQKVVRVFEFIAAPAKK